MQDVDTNPTEGDSTEALLIPQEMDYVPEDAGVRQSTRPEPDPGTDLGPGCIVSVVIESRATAVDEAASNRYLGHVEAADSFSVPEVLHPSQLVPEAYRSPMDMEVIVEDASERKT